MAGNEEILFNVVGDVSEAVTALENWMSAIDNVTKAFEGLSEALTGLDEQIGALSGSIDGLVQSFQALDQAAQEAGATVAEVAGQLGTIGDANATVASTSADASAGLGDVAAGLTTINDAATPVATTIDDVVVSLTGMQDSAMAAIDELDAFDPSMAAASAAFINLNASIDESITALSGMTDTTVNMDAVVNNLAGPISNVNSALSALSEEAAGPAQAAFMQLLDQFDQVMTSAGELASAATAASDATSTLAGNVANAGAAASGSAAGLDEAGVAAATLADGTITATNSVLALVAQQPALQATLVQSAQVVTQSTQAWNDLTTMMNGFSGMIDSVIGQVNALGASLLALATDEEEAGAGGKDAEAGMGGDAYMLMMLIPMILQAAGGFIQLGTAAEDSIAHITGMADQSLQGAASAAKLDGVIKALETDTMQYGGTLAQTADGMYFIISSGFQGADALKVLNVAMETAGATSVKFQTVATALTSTMNAYGVSAGNAKQIQDQLMAAVVSGNQTYENFATVIGKTAAQGKAAGFSLREVLAAESAMTQVNPSVRQDTANLGNLMNVLHNNMDKTAKAAQGLNLKFNEQTYAGKDLVEKLQYLQSVTHGNWTEMRALLGNSTATNAAFYILANGGKNVAAALDKQTQAAGSLDRAFQANSQTISFALSRISGALSVMAYTFVRAMGPVVAPMIEAFANLMGKVAGNMNILVPVITAVAIVLGVVLIAAMSAVAGMFSGILTGILPIAIALGVLAGAAMAVVPHLLALYHSAGPIGAMLRDMVATVKSTAMSLRDAFGGAIAALHPLLQGLGTILRSVVLPALASLAGGIGYSVAQIMNMIANAVRAATPHILAFGNYVKTSIAPALQAALPHIEAFAMQVGKMLPALLPIIAGLLGFKGVIGTIVGFLGPLHSGLGMVSTGFNAVKGAINFVVTSFGMAGGAISILMSNFGNFLNALRILGSFILGNFSNALNFLKTIGPAIGAFISGAGGPLQALFQIVRAGAGAIWGFAGDLFALMNPVSLVAGLVIALGAVLIWWLTTTKQGQQVLAGLWGALVKLGQVILSSLQPAWTSLQASMRLIWASMLQMWAAIQPLMPIFIKLAQIIGIIVVVAIAVAIAAIVGIITALANFVAGLVSVIAHVIQFVTGILQLFGGMWNFLKGLFTHNAALQEQGWRMMTQGIQNIWNGFTGAIVGVFKTVINTILGLGKGFFSALSGMFSGFANAVVHHSIWPDMWTAIHANTVTSTAQVHAQVQTFTTNTQASFVQMQAQSVATVTTMWKQMQAQTTLSMNASAAAVRTGFTAMVAQVNASGSMIWQAVARTWMLVAKEVTQQLALTVSFVQSAFALMVAEVAKADTLLVSQNATTWKTVGIDTITDLKLLLALITVTYATIDKTISDHLKNVQLINRQTWTQINQDVKTYWTQIVQLYTQSWQTIYTLTKTNLTNIETLYTQDWALQIKNLKANLLMETTLWTQFWLTLIKLDQANWKTMVLDWTNGLKLLNTALLAGIKLIETTIQTLITWITQQMLALDKSATTWGQDFAKNFAAGITSGQGAVRTAVQGMAAIAQQNLGHSKPSTGVMADDDMWGQHFIQNFIRGIQVELPALNMAAQNAASVIAAAMPTAQNVAGATRTSNGNVTSGSEHLAVLKQILAQLKQNTQGGAGGMTNNYGATQIGYNIPSTQLGTIQQQFSNGSKGLSSTEIANIYNQINQLQGLSQEYAARGASTGVGF